MKQCRARYQLFCNGVHLITYFCQKKEGHEGRHELNWSIDNYEEYLESDTLINVESMVGNGSA